MVYVDETKNSKIYLSHFALNIYADLKHCSSPRALHEDIIVEYIGSKPDYIALKLVQLVFKPRSNQNGVTALTGTCQLQIS